MGGLFVNDRVAQNLQGYLSFKRDLISQINNAHRAAANRFDDFKIAHFLCE